MWLRESNVTRNIIKDSEYITLEREAELVSDLRGDDVAKAKRARDVLVTSHLRLATKHIQVRASKQKIGTFDFDDLYQQAAIGLCLAADKFDPDYGVRFSTYAKYYVQMVVDRYFLANNYHVRLPDTPKVRSVALNYHRAKRDVERQADHKLSEAERLELISEKLGVQMMMLKPLSRLLDVPSINLDKEYIVKGDNVKGTYKDRLPDESVDIEDRLDYQLFIERRIGKLRELIEALPERERDIYESRIVQHTEDKLTLNELSDRHGISRERVRQIEVSIIKKITKIVKEGTQ